MILLINICKEKLHYSEFVRPIEDILKVAKIPFFTRDYLRINENDLDKCTKAIICGTSLKDNEFMSDIGRFNWIKSFNKPLLGICGGMQVIGASFGAKLGQKTEIGFYFEEFKKEFLGLAEKQEVYHLHNRFCYLPREFISYTNSEIIQAMKHPGKEIYGTLFHPEVRQKEMILSFCKI